MSLADDPFCIRAASARVAGEDRAASLNNDPFNLRAEHFALAACMPAAPELVGKQWSEQSMVLSSFGCVVPGTPDGMFEDLSSGSARLVCVQVVRMPLHPARTPAYAVARLVYNT